MCRECAPGSERERLERGLQGSRGGVSYPVQCCIFHNVYGEESFCAFFLAWLVKPIPRKMKVIFLLNFALKYALSEREGGEGERERTRARTNVCHLKLQCDNIKNHHSERARASRSK